MVFEPRFQVFPYYLLRVSLIELWQMLLEGGNKMSQSMPEVLDYRNLVGKLARIDSEWESLKGLLTFRVPYQNDEPAKSPAGHGAFPMDMANKVVEFPDPSSAVKIPKGREGVHSPMAVTPRELEAISQKNGENGPDKTLVGRLITVERQIHKLTFLVTAFMTLTIVLLGAITFLGFKDNLINRGAFRQPQQIAASPNTSSPEAMVPANDHRAATVAPMALANDCQVSSATAMTSPSDPQSVNATAIPVANVGKSPEKETSPAVAVPAPKFVGSMTSNKAHYPDCKWAAKINPKNLITFPSLAAAREKGYIPCPVCRPLESDETH